MSYQPPTPAPRLDISLGEIARVLWRRKVVFLLILVASLGLAALASHRTAQRWRSTAQMTLVQRATTDTGLKPTYAPPVIETVDTLMAMLQSDAMPQRASDWLRSHPSGPPLPAGVVWTPKSIQRLITINNPKDTNVILVTSEAAAPEQAAQVANAVCQAFLQWKKELAQQQVQEIAQSLQVRSAQAARQLQDAEQQEKHFKQDHHLADVAAQEKSLLDQYQSQQAETATLQKESASLSARRLALGGKLQTTNAQIKGGAGLRDDAQVQSLQSQLTQLEMERADAAQKVTKFYPGILPQLDAKIHDLKVRLAQSVHSILSGGAATLQSQAALLNDYQGTQISEIYTAAKLAGALRLQSRMEAQIRQLPQIDADYKQIARNVELTTTLYSSLQSSLEAARLDAEITTGDVQVTQPALVPSQPFRPNLGQNLSLAALAGLFLASLAVVVWEQLDRRVRDLADVQRLVSSPVLGALPVLPRSQVSTLSAGSGSAQALEAYRLTYANLLLAFQQSGQENLCRRSVILVTSAVPGEGKTVTARHLAHAIARCGKRTILVDADLRPTFQKGQAVSTPDGRESIGLADVLRGEAPLETALIDSSDPHFLLLGPGRVDGESADLVSLPQMKRALENLREMAEVVVIDAPACLTRADVFFLAPLADCVLQVVGAGRVDEAALRQTYGALAASRPRLMSLFFNFSPDHTPALLSGDWAGGPLPSAALRANYPALDLAEKILLSENKTTKIIVQNLPGQGPAVRLARPTHLE